MKRAEVVATVVVVALMALVLVNEAHPFLPVWEAAPEVEEKPHEPEAKQAAVHATPPPLEAGMARFGYDQVGDDGQDVLEEISIFGTRFPYPSGVPTEAAATGAVTAAFSAWPSVTNCTILNNRLHSAYAEVDPHTGEVDAIVGYLSYSPTTAPAATNPVVQAGIYTDNGTLVGQSQSVTFAGAATQGWFRFPVSGVTLAATNTYQIAWWRNNGPADPMKDSVYLVYDVPADYQPPDYSIWDPSPTYSASHYVYHDGDGDGFYELYHAAGTAAPGTEPPAAPWEEEGGGIMGEATPGAFLGRIRMGRESATQYGDQTTVTTYIWPCMSMITQNSNKNPVETNCKTGERGVRDLHSTRITEDGRIRCEAGPENLHKLLYWAHGGHAVASTISGPTTPAYEHNVATGTANTPYSFSSWIDYGEQNRSGATMVTLKPGMFITGYDVTIGDRSLLTFDFDWIGKEERLVAPTVAFAPSLSTLQPFVSKEHLRSIALDGRELAGQFVSGSIRYDGTITGRENAGSRNIQGAHAGRGRATIEFTLDFDDVATLKEYMDGSPTTSPTLPVAMVFPDTEGVLEFNWESDEVLTTVGGTQFYGLRCRAPRYQFTAMVRELPEDSDSPIRVDFSGQALQSFAATSVALRGDLIWRFYNGLAAGAFTS